MRFLCRWLCRWSHWPSARPPTQASRGKPSSVQVGCRFGWLACCNEPRPPPLEPLWCGLCCMGLSRLHACHIVHIYGPPAFMSASCCRPPACARAGDPLNKDTCQGDSGGPLFLKGANATADMLVSGMVQPSWLPGGGCWSAGCVSHGRQGLQRLMCSGWQPPALALPNRLPIRLVCPLPVFLPV